MKSRSRILANWHSKEHFYKDNNNLNNTMKNKFLKTFFVALLCVFNTSVYHSQSVCNNSGNLIVYTNYDGGIININVDVSIPNLKIGICSYASASITIGGAFASNVTQVVYAGLDGGDNCGAGVFSTSISGVTPSITSIFVLPTFSYSPVHGFGNSSGIVCGYACDTSVWAGGCNTPDEIVSYFIQATGGVYRYQEIQYGCWPNIPYNVSSGGNCCLQPAILGGCPPPSNPVNTTPSGNLSVCSNTTTTLTSLSPLTINWYATSTSSAVLGTGSNFIPPILSAGVYTYYASATNSCGVSSGRTNFTFTVNPGPPLTILPATAILCAGQSLTLTAGGANTYSWNTGSLSSTISITPVLSTNYTVTGTSTLSGCKSTVVKSVTVNPLPALTLSITNAPICVNGPSLALTGSPSGGNYSGTNVTGSSFLPGAANGSFTALYEYTNSVTGCSSTQSLALTVNALPSVSLSTSSKSLCAKSGSVVLTGSPIGGSYSGINVNGPAFTPGTISGTFTPLYTFTNTSTGCSNSQSITIFVFACVGIQENNELKEIVTIFPNPSNGTFSVKWNSSSAFNIELIDLAGRSVFKSINQNSGAMLDISALEDGIYYCKVSSSKGQKTLKLVKQ
jgi:hypothetical protein